jgi:2-polyprenyl-3-methyl-5-hydroxy-6-metoxy-1,4-benzoquinol methylase
LFGDRKFVGCDLRAGVGVDVRCDYSRLPFADESVGCVVMTDTLEHVERVRDAVSESHRILRGDGVLIISSAMDFPIHEHPDDYWRFTPAGFDVLLKEFQDRMVFYQGRSVMPHTILGIGFREGRTDEFKTQLIQELAERLDGAVKVYARDASVAATTDAIYTHVRDKARTRFAADKYGTYIHLDDFNPQDAHHQILIRVRTNAKVLEFGCAAGHMSKALKEDLNCTVTGIEMNETSAREAERYCERVVIGDIENLDYEQELPERFDVVLFSDVLEHLREPDRILYATRNLLSPDGYVLASIPNIAHASVALPLLEGEFDYQSTGILDRSHLRFYTKKGVEELFEMSGYYIDSIGRVKIAPRFAHRTLDESDYPPEVVDYMKQSPEWDTMQFIVKAYPGSDANAMKRLCEKLEEARAALQDKRRTNVLEIERLRMVLWQEVERLTGLNEGLQKHAANLEELREREKKHASEVIALLEKDIKERDAVIENIMAKLPVRLYTKIKGAFKRT